jgi:hypothetical protein
MMGMKNFGFDYYRVSPDMNPAVIALRLRRLRSGRIFLFFVVGWSGFNLIRNRLEESADFQSTVLDGIGILLGVALVLLVNNLIKQIRLIQHQQEAKQGDT